MSLSHIAAPGEHRRQHPRMASPLGLERQEDA